MKGCFFALGFVGGAIDKEASIQGQDQPKTATCEGKLGTQINGHVSKSARFPKFCFSRFPFWFLFKATLQGGLQQKHTPNRCLVPFGPYMGYLEL